MTRIPGNDGVRLAVYFIGFVLLMIALVLIVPEADAQTQATRVTPYDWQCQDAQGNRISDHQREGTAIVACINAPNGAYVQGGRYRITSNAAPPPPAPSAVLSWRAPASNTDGSTLTTLAGYRISYGTTQTALAQTIQVANPGVTRYEVTGLPPGTYYFAVRAYTSTGAESAPSNIVTKVVL